MHDGQLAVGRTLPGRGAWLCPTVGCVELAVRRRALPRALRAEIEPQSAERLLRAFVSDGPGVRG